MFNFTAILFILIGRSIATREEDIFQNIIHYLKYFLPICLEPLDELGFSGGFGAGGEDCCFCFKLSNGC